MMHLHHPSLSMSGKKKGKKKFRNAEEARKARELDESWKALKKQWGVEGEEKNRRRTRSAEVRVSEPNRRLSEPKIPSLNTGWVPCTKKAAPVYTGDKIIGISTLHKSNAVPVFSRQDAIDISKMRR
jgi:hypothetical protein